jgi:hypothetical protein
MEIQPPAYKVAIDGVLRPEIIPVEFSDSYGLTPAKLVLLHPKATYNQNVFIEGQTVTCEMFRKGNKGRDYIQRFLGKITAINDNYSFSPGVSCTCEDMRVVLIQDRVRRDYNRRNPVTEVIEEYPTAWSIYQIIDDIMRNFYIRYRQTHNISDDSYVPIMIKGHNIPQVVNYEVRKFTGFTIAEVLALVVDELLDGSYQWVLNYNVAGPNWTPVLELLSFTGNAQFTRNYYYGIDPTRGIENQQLPGRVNVNVIEHQEDFSRIEDRVIVLGDNIMEQRLLKCTPYYAFPRNRMSVTLEGEWYWNVTENNPKRMSRNNVIGLFMCDQYQDIFLDKNENYGMVMNKDYNPDMDFIGKRFIINQHLMYDPRKSETPEVIDQYWPDKYLCWPGETEIPDEMMQHCSWRIPHVSDRLFVLPLNRAMTNENFQSLDESESSSSVFMYRYYTDWLRIQRIPYYKTQYDLDPFHPDLLWKRKFEGVAIKHGSVLLDERVIGKRCVLHELLYFPAEDPGDNVANGEQYDFTTKVRPLCMDVPHFDLYDDASEWNETDGLVNIDMTWPEVVALFDDLFAPFFPADTFDTSPSVDGNHFLKWFGVRPDAWQADPSYTGAPPKPIISWVGTWTRMWQNSTVDGNTVIYTSNPASRTPQEGFVYQDWTVLQQVEFYEFPMESYVVGIVNDTRRAKYDSGKRSSYVNGATIILENNDFKRQRLGRNAVYDIDYRSDKRRLGLVDYAHDILSQFGSVTLFGTEKELGYLSSAPTSPYLYPNGYDLVNHASDQRQTTPPYGVLHLDEPAIVNTGSPDPDKSRMGKYGLAKIRKSMLQHSHISLTIEQMDFMVKVGDKVELNRGSVNVSDVRVVSVSHKFYGGGSTSSNQTIVTVATVV